MAGYQYLSFNESAGGCRFSIPGVPEEESSEAIRALREPMRLKSSWTLWEQPLATGTNYTTNLRKTVTFNTAQEFWQVWNGVPQPSELLDCKRFMREQPNGQSLVIDGLMIFRENIAPEWEDPANANGGHFQVVLKPTCSGGPGQIDEYWNNLVLAVIGETLDSTNLITGVRLVDKLTGKGKVTDAIRLELWYHSRATQADANNLKKNMERCLTLRLDNNSSPAFNREAIQDKKHASSLQGK